MADDDKNVLKLEIKKLELKVTLQTGVLISLYGAVIQLYGLVPDFSHPGVKKLQESIEEISARLDGVISDGASE